MSAPVQPLMPVPSIAAQADPSMSVAATAADSPPRLGLLNSGYFFDRATPEVRANVGDRLSLEDRQVRDMEFGKAPESIARELIEIALHFGAPADLQIIARKVAKAAVDIEHHPAFLLKIQVAGYAEFLDPLVQEGAGLGDDASREHEPCPEKSHAECQ